MRLRRFILATTLIVLSRPLLADDLIFAGSPSACDPGVSSCLPEPEKTVCDVTVCFTTAEGQRQYETMHGCAFPSTSPCGEFDTSTQCCGKNPRTGKAMIIDKVLGTPGVLIPGSDSFTWANLKMACPNRRQNDSPPDGAWSMCEIGKKHDAEDDYAIIERWENGTVRPFCIDGCSTPPGIVSTLYGLGTFLRPDRNNPMGYSEASSFLGACIDHDVCYQTCKKEQRGCDDELLKNMINACAEIPHHSLSAPITPLPVVVRTRSHCIRAARVMYTGLVLGGHTAFNKRRQQYCQCC